MNTQFLIEGLDNSRTVVELGPCLTKQELDETLPRFLNTYSKVNVWTVVLNESGDELFKGHAYYQNGTLIYEHKTIC